mmetsp:Transcript_27174/g.35626  ORF Transcript_27174/g.35626 Transcript_27174/m.35626 type:complete len:231 (+) Transcript_27174:259-951(+)|eukprot:CAMPEP_0117757646 /NCGR_PEP_ID=MMETSP0947-20121206/14865_1 /TAXON_ID=44440 /ORGANISM="Chattonella subsalsa, Strain CCMP2191" /LENGTH=230 /DNA_ID=CAMNT_0005577599 /DNA_START=223 /DNA_END=915 /DNA_ORIENTATION=-
MNNNHAMQMVQEAVGSQMLRAAEEKEEKLESEIQKLENLDEDDFERLREIRKQRLIKQQSERQEWLSNGHGRYMELGDQQEFFDATKKSKRIVAHFYRAATERCQIVDAHLQKLCVTHLETRFVKIDAEKSPFLVERLNIFMMPTILCIKEGKVEHHIRGFDEMGGIDDFSTEVMAYVLSTHGLLNYDGGMPEPPDSPEDRGDGPLSFHVSKKNPIRDGDHEYNSDNDDY